MSLSVTRSRDDLREGPFLVQGAFRVQSVTHIESTPLAATMESTKTQRPQQGAALMKGMTKYVAFDVHQATTEGGQEKAQSAAS